MASNLFRTKKLDELFDETEGVERLKRALGPIDLIALGIGAIIGAGIFTTTGTAAAGSLDRLGAGPALILSFVITGVACGFAALCYAELASMIPIAGSAYTYSYATLGELIAWIIGWDLVLEYAVGNVAVAIGWSGYFVVLLEGFGITIPPWLTTEYQAGLANPAILSAAPRLFGFPVLVNLPAAFSVAAITIILVIGIKESARFNTVMVAIKLVILLMFIGVGVSYVRPEHWHPFMPNGWAGVQAGAAIAFFSYIGFDAVSTAAEEVKNPSRDLPIGMIGSLVICTILYIVVAAVLTGLVPYTQLNTADPLTTALQVLHIDWAVGLVAFGAVIATTAVLLVFQLGQARICYSMARDGLLPKVFMRLHPTFKTPHVSTILIGIFVALPSAFFGIAEVVELTNIGTLFAFILVCIGVIVLRRKDPDRPRPFRCPLVPAVPIIGIGFCLYLMLGLPRITWERFGIWLVVGLLLYFLYGRKRSALKDSGLGVRERTG
ncbi:MAG: amino acid permease [Candidatus Latescibacteria bacterium]|nr:amino acid permease [Candidatus Latescibacterota bacterium]